MRSKQSHKRTIDRDILIVETAKMTGLRCGELADLIVGALHLNENEPVSKVP